MHHPGRRFHRWGGPGAWFAVALLLATTAEGAFAVERAYGTATFPCPPALRPRVDFWIRIFTEYDGSQRVIHDARYPWVVYEIVPVGDLDQKRIKKLIDQRKDYYGHLLDRLSSRPSALWSAEERRVAALLDSVPAGARFTGARERIRSQPGIRDQFRLGLQRAGRYRELMEAVFDSAGVPREILLLPHVESSFHPGAVSKAGAVGLWQFMPATGRKYLRVEAELDERLDPVRSTEAAARYLRAAYNELGTWPLAVVSYNHGVAGMSRARLVTGSTEIDRVLLGYDGPGFGFASQNFYCEFLAAIEVSSRPEQYFDGEVAPDPPWSAAEYRLPDYVRWPTLARAFGVDPDELATLNPAVGPSYRSGRRPVPRGYVLRLPVESGLDLTSKYESIPRSERHDRATAASYRVRTGDTLGSIAQRHRIPLSALLRLNGLHRRSVIRPGQLLALPESAGAGS